MHVDYHDIEGPAIGPEDLACGIVAYRSDPVKLWEWARLIEGGIIPRDYQGKEEGPEAKLRESIWPLAFGEGLSPFILALAESFAGDCVEQEHKFQILVDKDISPKEREACGVIAIGCFRDRFIVTLDYWTAEQYQLKWQEELLRLLVGAPAVGLMTWMWPNAEQNRRAWILYRKENSPVVYVQEKLYPAGTHAEFDDQEHLISIAPRETNSEEDERVSEWKTDAIAILVFLLLQGYVECKNCGRTNPPKTKRCDCGYDLDQDGQEKVSQAEVAQVSRPVQESRLRSMVTSMGFSLMIWLILVGIGDIIREAIGALTSMLGFSVHIPKEIWLLIAAPIALIAATIREVRKTKLISLIASAFGDIRKTMSKP